MRSYITISDEEKNDILQKHSGFYDGYSVGNVPNEPQPLSVGNGASDPNGITVDNKGNVKTYQNHKINESVISEKKKDDKWIQDVDMDEGDFSEYCNGKVTCGCVEKALKTKGKRKKQAQLYLNMNSDKCKSLQESKLNEIEADDMDISDEESAFAFNSGGPEQFDSSYSDDSYGMDIDSIMKMFGTDMSPAEYGDEEDMMSADLDGKEMYGDEEPAYDFDSEGGNMDVYGESVVNEEDDKGLKLPTNVKFPDIEGWKRPNKGMRGREETQVMYQKDNVTVTFRQNQADENIIEISVVGDDDLMKKLAGSIKRNDLQSKIDMFKELVESLNEGMIEKNISKEDAWKKFQKEKFVTDKTVKVARKDFEKMWSETNSYVNEEETESMCEQCGGEMREGEQCEQCGSMYEEMDDKLYEAFKKEKMRINEIFNRFK